MGEDTEVDGGRAEGSGGSTLLSLVLFLDEGGMKCSKSESELERASSDGCSFGP